MTLSGPWSNVLIRYSSPSWPWQPLPNPTFALPLPVCVAHCLQYVAILRASPEVEVVFRDLDAFIAELQFLGTHAPDGFQARLSLDIKKRIYMWLGGVGGLEVMDLHQLNVYEPFSVFLSKGFLGFNNGVQRVSPSLEAIVLSTWHCASQSLLSCGAIFNDQAYYLGGGGTRERHRWDTQSTAGPLLDAYRRRSVLSIPPQG